MKELSITECREIYMLYLIQLLEQSCEMGINIPALNLRNWRVEEIDN